MLPDRAISAFSHRTRKAFLLKTGLYFIACVWLVTRCHNEFPPLPRLVCGKIQWEDHSWTFLTLQGKGIRSYSLSVYTPVSYLNRYLCHPDMGYEENNVQCQHWETNGEIYLVETFAFSP